MTRFTSGTEQAVTPRIGRAAAPARRWRAIGKRTAVATGGALVAAVAAWFVADRAVGPLVVEFTDGERMVVGAGNVVLATLVGSAGGGLLAWLAGFAPRPRATFVLVALALLLASMTMPLMAGTDAGTAGSLVALHVVVAAIVVGSLARVLPATNGGTGR